ncbi:MAG: fusion protein PurCD [Chlamydiales bacterium]|jgi:fusion protein PurCD
MNTIKQFSTPQLKKIHSGKVRESLRVDDQSRLIVVTDRVSCFDRIMKNTIPHKGAVLNGLASAWLNKTRHIIDNHLLEVIDPNISLVREAEPIRVEMIVRKYLTGSIWREYSKGNRCFSGVTLPDGLQRNDPFPEPIITPTTKDVVDVAITPEEIVASGLVSKEHYEEMVSVSSKLFSFGYELCSSKNLILVDTKYEFGLLDGKLILIDEIHTPDSSRFWCAEHYEKDSSKEYSLDKEFVRQWILSQPNSDKVTSLPREVVEEASRRYIMVYEALLGESPRTESEDIHRRMSENLQRSNIIKDGYISIVMASRRDLDHAMKIKKEIEAYDVMIDFRVVSAHKNGEDIIPMAEEYNNSVEPGAVIAIAGRSNGLGGALSANLAIPVINCPPFKDQVDMMINLNSSLMMPTNAPAATCIGADAAAQMALRSLNLARLKKRFQEEIVEVKAELNKEDRRLREKAEEYAAQ